MAGCGLVIEDGIINILRGVVATRDASARSELACGSLELSLDSYERFRVQKAILRLIADVGGGEEKCRLLEDGWMPDRYLKVADENAFNWVAAAICSSLDLDPFLKDAEATSNGTRSGRYDLCWEGLGATLRGEVFKSTGLRGRHVYIGGRQSPTTSTPGYLDGLNMSTAASGYMGARQTMVDESILPEAVNFAGFTFSVDNAREGPKECCILLYASETLYTFNPMEGILQRVHGLFIPADVVVAQGVPKELALSEMLTRVGCGYCSYMMSRAKGAAVAVWRFFERFSSGFEAMRSALGNSDDKHPTFDQLRNVFVKNDKELQDSLEYRWSCRKAFIERCTQEYGSTPSTTTSVTVTSLNAICKLGEAAPTGLLVKLHEKSGYGSKPKLYDSESDERGIIAAYIYASFADTADKAASSSVVTDKKSVKVRIVKAPYGISLSVPLSGCVLLSFPEEPETIQKWKIYQPFDGVNAMRLRDLPLVVRLLGFDRDRAVIKNLADRLLKRPFLLTRPYGPDFFQAIEKKWSNDTPPSIAGMLNSPSLSGLSVPARCVREAVALIKSAGGFATPEDGNFQGYLKALEAWQKDELRDRFRIRCDLGIPFDGVICSKHEHGDICLWSEPNRSHWVKLDIRQEGTPITQSDRRLPEWQAYMMMKNGAPEKFWETEEIFSGGSGRAVTVRGSGPEDKVTGMVVLEEFTIE